jgi:hypothetical protein
MTEFSFMRPFEEAVAATLDIGALGRAMKEARDEPLDAFNLAPFVELDCGVPWVEDRGWLEFNGFTAIRAVPSQAYFPGGAGDSAMLGITVVTRQGKEYLGVMNCICSYGEVNLGFRIEQLYLGTIGTVGAKAVADKQSIVFRFKARGDRDVIYIHSQEDLPFWRFYSVKIFEHV